MAEVFSARTPTLVALTVIAVLAGAYTLGNSAGRNPPGTGFDPAAAVSPPAPAAAQQVAAARMVADGPAATAVDGPPLPAERGGPFGSRRTTGGRGVALTFDDGPDPRYTPQTLALLRSWRVKATFCLVGVNARAYPQLVRAIVAEGHTLCNHSWNHDIRLGSRPRADIQADLSRANEAIRAAAPGASIFYYRQPGGRWTSAVVTVARGLGMTSLHWAVDPADWRRPGPSTIAARVIAGTGAGDIVLLHDAGGDRSGTVSALRSILPSLARRFRLIALPAGTVAPRPPTPRPSPT